MNSKYNKIAGLLVVLAFMATLTGVVAIFGDSFHVQSLTREFGGEQVIELPANEKLVPYTVQWEKDSSIWYLTEPMESNYEPKKYKFNESSNIGVLQGTLVFREHKEVK